jgi:hypothetical protein
MRPNAAHFQSFSMIWAFYNPLNGLKFHKIYDFFPIMGKYKTKWPIPEKL